MDSKITESFFSDGCSRMLRGQPIKLKTWAEIFFWENESFIQGASDGWITSPLGCFSLWKIFLYVPLPLC